MSYLTALFARVEAMDVKHAGGWPCPVVELLFGYFGVQYGSYLLWNYTAFPCSDEYALEQAKALVTADLEGRFKSYIHEEDGRIEWAMHRGAADFAEPEHRQYLKFGLGV